MSAGRGEWACLPPSLITPHVQRKRGKLIGVGVHIYIYIYIYMLVDQKKDHTLAIDSPIQTFTIGLLVEFIDYTAQPLRSPETL